MNKYNQLSDNELAALLQQGSQEAYLAIYDRYRFVLQQHAYKKLGDMDEVADVIQELFIQLWDTKYTLNFTTSLSGYLFTAVRNKVFNLYYKKQRESNYLASLQEFIDKGEYSTDLTIREREFAALIEKEIAALPSRMREVFNLSRNEGLSHKEIAEKLGTSEHTVSTQIRNSLKVLRVRLGSFMFLLFFL